ncbi:disks large-associated protein 5 isoform X2 [Pantherophis guttatus]|uniref:Disks large-associated protein 5 isoform X2 n=1 Tax=Pantherophis guttatus TaxID=94885 RepID=A0ABM3ZML0_PANGU|nr:disks large-associated protein 5 isoform X2 [Pantherophis guttatus]
MWVGVTWLGGGGDGLWSPAGGRPSLLNLPIKMTTNFATRYKKDLSIDTLKTKLVRRKSTIQKENRHKEFNKGRQFGLVDVNIQPSRDKATSQLGGKSKGGVPKPNAAVKTREQERIDMLHRYKAEKELRKLKEQREKPIFKCGQFKPDLPAFLSKASQIPVLNKSKEKEAPIVMRVTRSKTKLPEPKKPQLSSVASSYTSKGRNRQIAQQEQKQIYIDKPSKQENKEMQSAISRITHGRTTRATVAAKSRIPQASQPTIISGNLPQKRVTIKGKQQKEIIKERTTVMHNTNKDILMEQEEEELKLHPAKSSEQKDFLDKENMSAPPKRNRSFAPQNFVFKPPKGLSTYKVKPMTPSRANVFLSPNLSWSPSEKNNEVYKEETNPELTKETTEGHQYALDLLEEIKEERVPSEIRDNIAFKGESSVQQPDLLASEISEPATKLLHDVSYFRNILQLEKERLTSFCLEWDKTVEMDIPEEAKDLVRTTIGQTRLLMAERFKQFEGLIDNCEFRRGEKETTCTDLDGFWDMVNFQVEDINKKFENLKKLEVNGWQMVDDAQPHRPAKKKPILRRTAKAAGGSAERRAARKRLASVKAAMKNKTKEGLAAEASGQEAERIFDGGFFKIESPAKLFPGRTPKSTHRISRWTTPRSANKALLQNCAEICVLKQGTSSTSKAVPPFPEPKAFSDSAGTDHRGSTTEKSGTQATEELYARTDKTEISTDEEPISCDRSSSSSDMDVYQLKEEASEIGDEMKQTTIDEVKQGFFSATENSRAAETCDQDEVQHTPERLSCNDGIFDLQPNLDVSLFFTPLRNKTENCISADSCSNLIVFSPFPDKEK